MIDSSETVSERDTIAGATGVPLLTRYLDSIELALNINKTNEGKKQNRKNDLWCIRLGVNIRIYCRGEDLNLSLFCFRCLMVLGIFMTRYRRVAWE